MIGEFIGIGVLAQAQVWFEGLLLEIEALSEMPGRGLPLANGRRQVLFGNKPHMYRIIYRIDERLETVFLLDIRHGARRRNS